ncbi:hypothetical protein AAEI00_21555, partial [Shewanella algae]|uniref:hypothetical protein n=1 Tax=Shewanella algae TaxID=38313 RepID=UPI00319C2145
MSSKGWKVWLVLFLIGCSKSVGTTDANQIRLRIGSTECFTGMGDRFKHYFSGSAQPMELAQAFTCMSQALNDFMSLTRG